MGFARDNPWGPPVPPYDHPSIQPLTAETPPPTATCPMLSTLI